MGICANELRIGNWVMYSSKIQVNENKIRECVDHPDRFAPIQLTDEWLQRFGFRLGGDDWYSICMPNGLFFDVERDTFDVVIGQGVDFSHNITELNYVHQLQNLFYYLTGEELKLQKQ